jgi:hypothetical protein
MSAAGGCRPQRRSIVFRAYFFFFAGAFFAGFFVATVPHLLPGGRAGSCVLPYFFFFAGFAAGFFAAGFFVAM